MDAVSSLTYWKCKDCLSAFTVDKKIRPDICACGGDVYYMGAVTPDHKRFEKVGVKSACDERCTNAAGPLCNCQCGGPNHGTGKVVTFVIAEGWVVVDPFDDNSQKVADEFRKAVRDAKWRIIAKFGDAYQRYKQHVGFNPTENYWAMRSADIKLAKARKIAIHKKRLEELAKIFPGENKDVKELAERLATL